MYMTTTLQKLRVEIHYTLLAKDRNLTRMKVKKKKIYIYTCTTVAFRLELREASLPSEKYITRAWNGLEIKLFLFILEHKTECQNLLALGYTTIPAQGKYTARGKATEWQLEVETTTKRYCLPRQKVTKQEWPGEKTMITGFNRLHCKEFGVITWEASTEGHWKCGIQSD